MTATKNVGGSVAVVIPAAIARELALTDGTALDVTTTADGIVMRRRDRRPRRRLGPPHPPVHLLSAKSCWGAPGHEPTGDSA